VYGTFAFEEFDGSFGCGARAGGNSQEHGDVDARDQQHAVWIGKRPDGFTMQFVRRRGYMARFQRTGKSAD